MTFKLTDWSKSVVDKKVIHVYIADLILVADSSSFSCGIMDCSQVPLLTQPVNSLTE